MDQLKVELPKSNAKISQNGTSPNKSQAQIRREKKKKMAAFKTFLNHIEPQENQDPLLKRRLSGQLTEEKLQIDPECKICKNLYRDNGKECTFCHETVCSSHIRKKRKNQNNKFARICDSCEDNFIYKKYLKNEMKIEETLTAQESLIQAKLKELHDQLKGKKTRLQVFKNKAAQLQANKNKEDKQYTTLKVDLERKFRKMEQKMGQLLKLQKQLLLTQKRLPPSLEADYEVLVQTDDTITKELVKYEKWCNDVIKARSIREKKMYEEYYEWEQTQKEQREELTKKQEECVIY